MTYEVLARKWRPRDLRAVVGQEATITALQHALANQQVHHAYLFSGTRGVGKTTLARILAKCVNCEQGMSAQPCGVCALCTSIDQGTCVDVIEIDAASRTKVEDTRDLLDNVPYAPVHARYKIYIIDEVHMLSKHSFNALLKTLEEPPPHVKFILATTDPQKLPDTIISRCLQFQLRSLTIEQIQTQLQYILQQEQIPFENDALATIAACANGSMRDALSLLEQVIAFGARKVTAEAAAQILGTNVDAATLELLRCIIQADASRALAIVAELSTQNADFNKILSTLQTLIYKITLAQIVPEQVENHISELASQIEAVDLQILYQTSLLGVRDLPYAPDLKIGFEMIVLRMIAFNPILDAPQPAPDPSTNRKIQPTVAEKSTAAAAPVMPAATVRPTPATAPATQPNAQQPADAWQKILPKLKLSGITKLIAEHCVLQRWDDANIELILSENQRPLLNDKHIERMQNAVREHLKTKAQVTITTGVLQAAPPAVAKQNAALHALRADKHIQQLEQTFSATIAEVNIKEQ